MRDPEQHSASATTVLHVGGQQRASLIALADAARPSSPPSHP